MTQEQKHFTRLRPTLVTNVQVSMFTTSADNTEVQVTSPTRLTVSVIAFTIEGKYNVVQDNKN